MQEPFITPRSSTTFTLNIDDKIYHCPVSTEAIYMLCRDQDRALSQLDAYLLLKMKVQAIIEMKLEEGRLPELLDVADFMRR